MGYIYSDHAAQIICKMIPHFMEVFQMLINLNAQFNFT